MWKARSLRGLSDEQYIELNRYTLDLIYHFYSEDSVYQGGSSPFGCNKLEKKIWMKRFEYKILDAAVIEPDLTKSDFPHIHFEEAREKMLNQYGKKGWELVTIDTHPNNGIKYIFKREYFQKRS